MALRSNAGISRGISCELELVWVELWADARAENSAIGIRVEKMRVEKMLEMQRMRPFMRSSNCEVLD
jgi:hypothetical protein